MFLYNKTQKKKVYTYIFILNICQIVEKREIKYKNAEWEIYFCTFSLLCSVSVGIFIHLFIYVYIILNLIIYYLLNIYLISNNANITKNIYLIRKLFMSVQPTTCHKFCDLISFFFAYENSNKI